MFRRLAHDSAIYGGADFFTKIIAFVSFPIVAAVLSPAAFGALELVLTATALLGLVAGCGMNNAVQRFYWDKDTLNIERPAIVSSGLAAQVAFGGVAVLAGLVLTYLAYPWVVAAEWPLTWVGLVSALCVMALSQWSQYVLDVLRLHFAPWRFFAVALISRVMNVAFGVVAVVLLGLGIDGLLSAQALVLLLVMPIGLLFIRRDLHVSRLNYAWAKELVRFGYPFIFAGLAYWLFASVDRWMLASMASVDEVGTYSIALRFSSVVLFFSAAFGQAWSPVAIKIRTDNPAGYREIYGHVLLLLLFAMLIVGGSVALFSGELIALIMPSEYLPSALPLALLSLGIVLHSSQQVTAIGISLERKTHLFARLAWMTALVNVAANWLLIPHLGAVGAAWATLISYGVLTLSYLAYTQQLHPLVIDWKRLAALLLLGFIIAIAAVALLMDEFLWPIALTKLLVGTACAALGWRLLPVRSMGAL